MFKKCITIILFSLFYFLMCNKVLAFTGSGLGTESSPYIITTKSQLKEVNQSLNSHYKLTSDIDLNNEPWTPIGTSTLPFSGTFDGNGHTISNLKINTTQSGAGLFGYVFGGKIKNINIDNVDVVSTGNHVGALAGYMIDKATNSAIENCSVTKGTVKGTSYVGGLVGFIRGKSVTSSVNPISSSYTECAVVGTAPTNTYVGGIAGYAYNTSINKCYSVGTVTGGTSVGGIVGDVTVTTSNIVDMIQNCFSLSSVKATSNLAGGIAGKSTSCSLYFCYFAGKVEGPANVGGLCGYIPSGVFSSSYFDGLRVERDMLTDKSQSKLTTALRSQNTYTLWDFTSIWAIDESTSYPYLKDLKKPLGVSKVFPEVDVAGGNGSSASPYIIDSVEQLKNINIELNSCYILNNDLDLNYIPWTPIGTSTQPFSGTFDGNGHTISNLKINTTQNYVGLFGYVSGGRLKNINIDNVDIVSTGSYVGALAGYVIDKATNINCVIENCSVTGTGSVKGNANIGGLVGYAGALANPITGSYTECAVVGTATTNTYVGGIAGYAYNAGINKCYSIGTVTGGTSVGGIVGDVTVTTNNFSIQNCFSLSSVKATSNLAGGIAGKSTSCSLYYCYFAGRVEGSANVGGLCGAMSYGVLTSSYFDGLRAESDLLTDKIQSKLTTALRSQNTYTLWDFTAIWAIDEANSYPYFKGLKKPLGVTEVFSNADVAGGNGSSTSPYIIDSVEQLKNIRFDLSSCYILNKDLDFNNEPWTPIGTSTQPFSGTFDGNGHTISNLKINTTQNYVGLFGYVSGGRLKNINIDNVDIVSTGSYVGALAGYVIDKATNINCVIENCSVTGTGSVKGNANIGGLVGYAGALANPITGSYTECAVVGTATTNTYVGGIAGYAYNAGINKCYSIGTVTGGTSVGGIVGDVTVTTNNFSIQNCFSLSSVKATSNLAGGIAGRSTLCSLYYCYFGGKVEGPANVGGLCGYMSYGVFSSSYFDGLRVERDLSLLTDKMQSKLTTALKLQNTYISWNFTSIWAIDEANSYPFLKDLKKPLGVTEVSTVEDVAGGNGSPTSPYIIDSTEQLKNIKFDLNSCYILNKDLDFNNEPWTPIGTNTQPFSGTFDGNGHTISNLKINTTQNYIGLFGYVAGGKLKNIKIDNVDIISSGSYVGALAGYMTDKATYLNSTIENCSITGTGTVKGSSYVGGFVGYTLGKSATSYVNSIIGSFTECAVVGTATTNTYVGGIAGYSYNTAINNCYSVGDVTGGSFVGGIVGDFSLTTQTINHMIQNCFSLSNIKATGSFAGGIAGISRSSSIYYCYSAGKVEGVGYVGGVCGYMDGGVFISVYFDGVRVERDLSMLTDKSESRLTTGLRSQNTYNSWNFTSIWAIDEANSYPYFQGLKKPLGVMEVFSVADVAGGNGSSTSPYIIESEEQLKNINYDLNSCYILSKDLDLNNASWTPIGTSTQPFSGTFDGNGHTISNLMINTTKDYAGLFGFVHGGKLRNINIDNVDINSTGSYVGSLAGYMINKASIRSVIDNCSVTGSGTVKGSTNVGGLVGYAKGIADGLYPVTNSITGSYTECAVAGTATTNTYVGGIAGYSYNTGINKCYSVGTVTGGRFVGGIVGDITVTTRSISEMIQNCFSLSTIKATDSFVGGIAGNSKDSSFYYCYYAGKIEGVSYVGGLCGYIPGGVCSYSYFDTIVSGITTPLTQAKTTEQLLQRATFQNWDFINTWENYEGLTYPGIKNMKKPFNNILTPPVGLKNIECTDTTIKLEWLAVDGAEEYELAYLDQSITTTELTIEISKLLPKTKYSFKVRAKGENKTGIWSEPIDVTTVPTPLKTVENVNCVTVTYDSVKLSWDGTEGANGYIVTLNDAKYDSSANSIFIKNLKPNTQYVVFVQAKNEDTIGEKSSPIEFVTAHKPPDAPTDIVISGKSAFSISLTWNEVAEAEFYEIDYNGEILTTYEALAVLTNLEPLTEYVIKVRGVNSAVQGTWSESITVRTYDLPLGKPLNLVCTDKTDVSATLSWDAVDKATYYELKYGENVLNFYSNSATVTGLLPNTSYKFSVRALNPNNSGTFSDELIVSTNLEKAGGLTSTKLGTDYIELVWNNLTGATGYELSVNDYIYSEDDNAATVINLEPLTEYVIKVRGVNAAVQGTWSESITVRTYDLPLGKPLNLVCTDKTDVSATLSWDAVDKATYYELKYGENVLNFYSNSATVTGLLPNTSYKFSVRALNPNNSGTFSDELIVSTNLEKAGGLTSTKLGTDYIELVWNNLTGATGYELSVNDYIYSEDDNAATVINLEPLTEYVIKVRGVNENVQGAWSESITISTYGLPLGIPQNLLCTNKTEVSATLSWDAVDNATYYELKYGDKVLIFYSNSATITGLLPYTGYKFTVRAINHSYYPSNFGDEMHLMTNLSKVTGILQDDKGFDFVNLRWNAVNGANQYEVNVNSEDIYFKDTNIAYITGLEPESSYVVKIRAINESVSGSWSEEFTFTTDPLPLDKPKNLENTERSNTSLTLTWDAVPEATYYIVTYGGTSVNAETNSLTIIGLNAYTDYTFTVQAKTATRESPLSDEATFKTKPTPLEKVTGLKRVTKSATSITLAWNSLTGADSYEVSVNGDLFYETVGTGITISNLEPSTSYVFSVRGMADENQGQWSDSITLSTSSSSLYNETTVFITTGNTYTYLLTAKNIESFDNPVFTVKYDPSKLELKDFAAHTKVANTSIGLIPGTKLEVLSHADGVIKLKCSRQLPQNKKFSGFVTAIQFKAKTTGSVVIELE